MAKYLVGKSINTWDFEQAYNVAIDGDTIEFEEDYTYTIQSNHHFEIRKSLNFLGNISRTEESTHFSNTIFSKISVRGGVTVRFTNIWFKTDQLNNNFSIFDNSKVEFNFVCFENINNQNDYPIIYSEKGSTIFAKNIWIQTLRNSHIYFESSSVTIADSSLNTMIKVNLDTNLELQNVNLENNGYNAINSTRSNLYLKNSTIIGGDIEKGYPAIWAKQSNLNIYNTKILQDKSEAALYIEDNSFLHSQKNELSSIQIFQSRALIDNTLIRETMSGINLSIIVAVNDTQFLGENNEKVDLFLNDCSSFISDRLIFNKSNNPNVRISLNSNLKTNKIIGNDIFFDISNDSSFMDSSQNNNRLSERMNENLSIPEEIQFSDEQEKRDELNNLIGLEKRDELNNLIGLEKVKKEINKMIGIVDFNNLRIKQGLQPEKMSLHSVFMGNPGTGKTMVARLIGEVLFTSGVLPGKEFIFVEASESDLISSNVGGTAEQTQRILDRAKGGILFIDEAYTLNKKDASVNHGQEAINTILKYMEDNREDIMIIFAGYTKEMEQFLKTNPGLESRVPNKFIFDDYTPDEIIEMGKTFLYSKKYILEDEEYYTRNVKYAYTRTLDKSNGRWIRNFNENIIKSLANRVFIEKTNDVTTIKNCDIDEVLNIGKYENLSGKDINSLETLDNLIGINLVKEKIKQFVALAELNKKREEQGQIATSFTLHSKFLGNPGTGKTTVARIVGNILYQKGIISQNKFIEVSRSDLVAGYIGQTAIKTREVLESALGGVLFIDEAYSLNNSSNNDFGLECIDEILKFMEDHRQDMVIIFAGYTKEMDEFLKMNSGLNSRIPNTFVFEDYTADEIVKIGLLGLKKYGYIVDEQKYSLVVKNNYDISNDNSNGRWIRNFNEELIRYMSSRIERENSQDLNTITDEDLRKMF